MLQWIRIVDENLYVKALFIPDGQAESNNMHIISVRTCFLKKTGLMRLRGCFMLSQKKKGNLLPVDFQKDANMHLWLFIKKKKLQQHNLRHEDCKEIRFF